jgi:hypothetical protein
MKNKKNESEKFIVLVGNIGDGHTAVGPYDDIEEAFEAHFGEECWVMTLQPPEPIEAAFDAPATMVATDRSQDDNVVDIFDYQKNWQPKDE